MVQWLGLCALTVKGLDSIPGWGTKIPQAMHRGQKKKKNFFFFFWPRCVACGILVPRPGIEPVPPPLGVWSLNHWTTREVPKLCAFLTNFFLKRLTLPMEFRHGSKSWGAGLLMHKELQKK